MQKTVKPIKSGATRLRWAILGVAAACGVVAAVSIPMAGCSRGGPGKTTITLESCLRELTSVETFARTPVGPSTLISSFDRTGGNRDWGSFAGVGPDDLFTVADLTGPGCIKRIWQTNLPDREWLLFFDGETEPRLRAGQHGIYGVDAPFLPPVCDRLSGGDFSYLPLPYARSLKVKVRVPADARGSNPMPFYHVNYETYPKGTQVESFPRELSPVDRKGLEDARTGWRLCDKIMQGMEVGGETVDLSLPPGQSVAWLSREGAGVLKAFQIALQPGRTLSPLYRARLLRLVFLRISWDGHGEPSVDVPLGDFFCNGLNKRTFSSLPLASRPGSFLCRFPMPFQKGVRAELRNDSGIPLTAKIGFEMGPAVSDGETVNYFHAKWNQSMSSGSPFRVLRTEGAGHYVGCYLVSLGMDGSWNNLEGDEVMFIDGETTPSWHGTGLEDYFNGAWYYRGLFDRPTHGLLEKAGMRTAQYRFHPSDPVKFDKSFSMTFEFGDGNRARGYMSSVAYWYQPEPHAAGTGAPPPQRRYPPIDQVARASLMAEMFELDGIGHLEEARERCLAHAEVFAKLPEGPMMRVRAAAYTEALDGFETARPLYEEVRSNAPDSDAGREAGNLVWFHASDTNGLVAANINGKYWLYVDGKLVLEDNSFMNVNGARVALGPGRHVIAAKVQWTYQDNWFMAHVRGHTTNLWADTTWRTSQAAGPGWEGLDYNDSGWAQATTRWWLPKIAHWQFRPHPYLMMQNRETIGPEGEGSNFPGRTSYFRKVFIVPDKTPGGA